jgi:hypothetical protein
MVIPCLDNKHIYSKYLGTPENHLAKYLIETHLYIGWIHRTKHYSTIKNI